MTLEELAEKDAVRRAYETVFAHPDAHIVLADLAVFCRETSTAADDGPGPIDPLALAREEGKRAAWLRIKNFLAMDRVALANELRRARAEVHAAVVHERNQARGGP